MRKDDLMKSCLVSEILVLAGGITIGITLAMIVIVAFTHTAAPQ